MNGKNLTLEEFLVVLDSKRDEFIKYVVRQRKGREEDWKMWEGDWWEQFVDFDTEGPQN